MKAKFLLIVLCLGVPISLMVWLSFSFTTEPVPVAQEVDLSHLPLRFIPNQGQVDPAIKFQVRGKQSDIFFASEGLFFSFPVWAEEELNNISVTNREHAIVRLTFEGINPQSTVEGIEALSGVINFFGGDNPTEWQNNIPTYGAVVYRDLYPGIHLFYQGQEGRLKSEFVVAPGADPALIRLHYQGIEAAEVRADGALILQTQEGKLVESPLVIYQEIGGERQQIKGRYLLEPFQNRSQKVSLQIGAYDPRYPLIIDPEIIYSSYLGGSVNDFGRDITVDQEGNIYLVGTTDSADFPVWNKIEPNGDTLQGGTDVFVTKIIQVSGVYTYAHTSYLGGTDHDEGNGIAVDGAGNIYVTGGTKSTDFPLQGELKSDPDSDVDDAFIAQIIETEGIYSLGFSTYLGGTLADIAHDIAVDEEGTIYVTGETRSLDFDVVKPIPDHGTNAGDLDVFVSKLVKSDGAYTYEYSTYLGGDRDDIGWAIAIDQEGNSYITGETEGFITRNELQNRQLLKDAFVSKIVPSNGGYSLGFSTYLGGNHDEVGQGIVVDEANNIYVTGWTRSTDLDVTHPVQSENAGSQDIFVVQYFKSGELYQYGYVTYLGGTGRDVGEAIALDKGGNAYLTGKTESTDFPAWYGFQNGSGGNGDAFALQIIQAGGVYTYGFASYLGGGNSDTGYGIAVDENGNSYVTGETSSTDFPLKEALQTDQLNDDAFVTKIEPNWADLNLTKSIQAESFQEGATVTYTVAISNYGPQPTQGVIVQDSLSSQLTFVQAMPSSGTQYEASTGLWQVGDLSLNQQATLILIATINENTLGQTVNNEASVYFSRQTDLITENNTGVYSFTVGSTPYDPHGFGKVYLPLLLK